MFSISTVKNVADCDILLRIARREQSDLEFRRTGLTRKHATSSESSIDIALEEQLVNLEINSLRQVIEGLPEGETKTNNTTKLKKLEYRQYVLGLRKESKGVVAMLDLELDLARVESELTTTLNYINAVETRKAELAAAA